MEIELVGERWLCFGGRYGRPSASGEEIQQAARDASIYEAITERFPHGFETVVGERGLRLSGGEKQRVRASRPCFPMPYQCHIQTRTSTHCAEQVGVARAILKSPQLLLMDEATSALDSMTEQRIQSALDRISSTKVIVAHRLSTIMAATHIIVMQVSFSRLYSVFIEPMLQLVAFWMLKIFLVAQEGRVVEVGSHPELIQQNGLYAEMWTRQVESTRQGMSAPPSAHSLVSHLGDDGPEEGMSLGLHGHHP